MTGRGTPSSLFVLQIRIAFSFRISHFLRISNFAFRICLSSQLTIRKEKPHLNATVFRRVRPMHNVLTLVVRIELADRTWRGVLWVRRSDQGAEVGNCIRFFQRDRHARTAGHEFDETVVERTAFVYGIERAGSLFRQSDLLHAENFESGFLDAGNDFALKAFTDTVGLEDR